MQIGRSTAGSYNGSLPLLQEEQGVCRRVQSDVCGGGDDVGE